MIYFKGYTHQSIAKMIYSILKKLDNPNLLLFETFHCNEKDYKIIDKWLEKENTTIFVISFHDPAYILPEKYKNLADDNRIRRITTQDIFFFLLLVDEHFLDYSEEQLQPYENFEYNFLCYQRKPNIQRINLYETLKDIPNGLVTIGNIEFNKINGGLSKTHGGDNDPNPLKVVADMYSLGKLEIWKKSFLNIVSETIQDLNDRIFLSEKTLKPILGMRPFIFYGHPQSSKFLKSKGFETFDEDFDFMIQPYYETQIETIKKTVLNIKEPELLYKKLLPKIKHNREHLATVIAKEKENLENLISFTKKL